MSDIRLNTAITVVIGPLIDWADGKTPLTDNNTFDPTLLHCELIKGSASEELTLAKTGDNSINLTGYGMATLTLTADNTDTLGPLRISITNAVVDGFASDLILPFVQDFTVRPITYGTPTPYISGETFTPPEGFDPANPFITAISVSAGVVTLTLTGDGAVSIYSRPAGAADWTLSATAASTDDPIEISGLTAGLTYEFYAVADGLGPELVINGGFDTDTGWTKGNGWFIEAGRAICGGTDTFRVLSQELASLDPTKIHYVSIKGIDVLDIELYVSLGGKNILGIVCDGVFTARALPGSADKILRLMAISREEEGSLLVDDVSVREDDAEYGGEYSPPSNIVRAFIYADGLSAIVNLEKWILGKLEALSVFKTVDSWKGQLSDDGGLAAFLKYTPFAFVSFDHIAPAREGGYDLNRRVGFSILVGAADDAAGIPRLGSAAKPGASLLMDYVIAALEGVHPGEGFTCDDFFFVESQITVNHSKMSAIQIGVEANWMNRDN